MHTEHSLKIISNIEKGDDTMRSMNSPPVDLEKYLVGRKHVFVSYEQGARMYSMEDACRRANVLTFIQGLQQGFETVIGENGIRLSGGQKQRLVIARILLQDPEVIVFDEATSALDYKNESQILELLLQNLEQKTFLMVTHRETAVSKCSRCIEWGKYNA